MTSHEKKTCIVMATHCANSSDLRSKWIELVAHPFLASGFHVVLCLLTLAEQPASQVLLLPFSLAWRRVFASLVNILRIDYIDVLHVCINIYVALDLCHKQQWMAWGSSSSLLPYLSPS